MIEVVYQGDVKEEPEGIALPKNVRQVGEPGRDRRVYIEDYVVTYIRQKIEENKNLGCILILTGRKEYIRDAVYLFADGAFLVEYEQVGKDYLFSDRVWETIYEKVKEYFSGGEIVGWLLYDDDLTGERLLKAQKKNFPAEDMLLIKRESYEEDCVCYLYRNGSLDELPGYFVYYEKNEAMQEFLVKNYQNPAKAAEDELALRKREEPVANFRKRMQRSREMKRHTGNGARGFLYAAGSFVLLVFILAGITMVNNYDKMQQFETAADLAGTPQSSGEKEAAIVEEAPSGVMPLPDSAEPDVPEMEAGNTASDGGGTKGGNALSDVAGAEAENTTSGGAGTNGGSAVSDVAGAEAENAAFGGAGTGEGSAVPDAAGANGEGSASGDGGTDGENATSDNAGADMAAAVPDSNAAETSGQEDAPVSAGISVQYTVQPGDTLLAISKRVYGTEQMVGKICAANGIHDGDKILAGQKILLP